MGYSRVKSYGCAPNALTWGENLETLRCEAMSATASHCRGGMILRLARPSSSCDSWWGLSEGSMGWVACEVKGFIVA
jgi:hypothetical protein